MLESQVQKLMALQELGDMNLKAAQEGMALTNPVES